MVGEIWSSDYALIEHVEKIKQLAHNFITRLYALPNGELVSFNSEEAFSIACFLG